MSTWVSTFNSSSVALAGGATFTGVAETTIGYPSIILTAKTDADGTLLIDFSPDGTNWDRTISYTLQTNLAEIHRVTCVNQYFRVRLINGSSAQSFLRMQCLLGDFPDPSFAFNSVAIQPDSGATLTKSMLLGSPFVNSVRSSITGALLADQSQTLIGQVVTGTTIDTNFWTSTVANNGSTTQQGGYIRIRTGSTANGAARLNSSKNARLLSGRANSFISVLALSHSGTASNITEWGVGNANNRIVFRLSGTTLSAVVRSSSSDVYTVASSSWNGNRSVPTLTNMNQYEIHYAPSAAVFVINGVLMHTINLNGQGSVYGLVEEPHLPIRIDNTNSSSSTSDLSVYVASSIVAAIGPETRVPVHKNITSATTTVCKLGTGYLHRIILGTAANGTIKLYDATTATNIFASITVSASDLPTVWDFGAQFNDGLTIVTSAATDITVIYE